MIQLRIWLTKINILEGNYFKEGHYFKEGLRY